MERHAIWHQRVKRDMDIKQSQHLKWFCVNDAQQSTIDRMIDELRILKLDETIKVHEQSNKFMQLIKSLSTLGEEVLPQNARNMFLNNTIEPDYENGKTILKGTK